MFTIGCAFSVPGASGVCPLGDLDGDCQVDLVDLQLLVGFWLDPDCAAPDCPADLINGAGVDLVDYAVLAENLHQTGVSIVISEFMADNDEFLWTYVNGHRDDPDWLELYNPSDAAVDLGGCYLTDSSGTPDQWPFPAHTILPPGGYLLVFASGKEQQDTPDNFPFVDDLGYLHTNFKLDKDGDYLALVLPDGHTVEFVYPTDYPEVERYSTQYENWSYGLSQDLTSQGYFFPATPGAPNGEPVPDPTRNIVINEIMYHPYHSQEGIITPEPLGEEYIELYNRGIQPVDLGGWRIADGVDFTLPDVPEAVLAPGGYLVIAADAEIFDQTYATPPGTVIFGGWSGHLSNRGEAVELEDEHGLSMNRVRYADEGDWSRRQLGPVDHQHRGWQWKDDHDGAGRSLELINAALSNQYGQNWAASQTAGGTPGAANSAAAANVAPMILDVEQAPLIPRSDQAVTVTARIRDEQPAGFTVKLYYRLDSSDYDESDPADQEVYPVFEPASYTQLVMRDDGLQDNGRAGDGVYGAVIPAHPAGSIIEFFLAAGDGILTRTWPAPADVDGTDRQVVNCLYQVYAPDALFDPESDWQPGSRPVYLLVMTNREQLRLQDIGNDGDPFAGEGNSSAQMNGTFIQFDGTDSRLRYGVGIRNRGNRSRVDPPNNYRINFRHDETWKDVTAININSKYAFNQVFASALWQWAGLPAADARLVQLRVNGTNEALADSAMQGSYAAVEAYDGDWPAHHVPDDDNGNLYRCTYYQEYDGGPRTYADLEHKGDPPYRNPDDYRDNYDKQTNGSADDWNDLFDLIDALMDTGSADPEYLEGISQEMNPAQWLRFLAVDALSGNLEGGLTSGQGDDYAMYRGLDDPRFLLLPHDMDTVLGQGDHTPDYDHSIFVYDGSLIEGLHRLLNDDEPVRDYFGQYLELIETVYAPESFDPLIDRVLGGRVSASTISQMKQFVVQRVHGTGGILDQVPHEDFSVTSDLPTAGGYLASSNPVLTGNNLSGRANAAEVLSVQVNGRTVSNWSQKAGTWSLAAGPTIILQPGINRVVVETFDGADGSGRSRQRQTVDFWYDDGLGSTVPNPLTGDSLTLEAASGPWFVNGNLTVPAGFTLSIEPGTTVYFDQSARLTVNGRLAANGAEYAHIRLTVDPDSADTAWGGILFSGTTEDNVLAYVDMEYSSSGGNSVNLSYSRCLLDHVTWTQTDKTILEIYRSSAIVRYCEFPDNAAAQTVSGHYLLASDPYLLLEGNLFGVHTGSKQDVLDFSTSGAATMPRFLNNVFLGGGDDALDLDGTNAYVAGNLFMNFHRNFTPTEGESYGVTSGYDAGNSSNHVIVRNWFIDCDTAALVKDRSWIRFENNTLVNCPVGINFNEPQETDVDPGRGGYLDGNIFWNVPTPLAQWAQDDPTWGTAEITVNRCLLAGSWQSFGRGNFYADPLFVDPGNGDYRLRAMSPARRTGPNGLDMGAAVDAGVTATVKTYRTAATVTVAGGGISHYAYAVNDPDGIWSAPRSVDEPIELSGLADQEWMTVYVRGRDCTGIWQTDPNDYAVVCWQVDAGEVPLRINEILARNRSAVEVDGSYPDLIELVNEGPEPVNLAGCTLTDDPANPDLYVFDAVVLEPNELLVLIADPNAARPGSVGFALDAGGEGLYLYDGLGRLIDSVEFGAQVADYSLGRWTGDTWQMTHPSLGQANQAAYTGDWASVRINEWLASEQVLFTDDFVELYNPNTAPVQISELYLTDNPVNQPAKSRIGPLTFVGGRDYAVFRADDQDESGHLDFRLSAEQEMIGLFDPEGGAIDKVLYGPQTTDVAQGIAADDPLAYAFYPLPTPGLANTAGASEPTLLNLIESGATVAYTVPGDSTDQDIWMQLNYPAAAVWPAQAAPLGFGQVAGPTGASWTAYNDCYKQSGDYTAANVTTYTIYNGYSGSTGGPLVDFAAGVNDDMPTVTFQMGPAGLATSSGSGARFVAGTPGYDVFHNDDGWIVDFGPGLVYYGSSGWYQEIHFTDLDPADVYSFVGTAIRSDASYTDRISQVSIEDADAYVWNCTGGVGGGGDTALLQAGGNQDRGDLVRWDNIQSGPDGDFTIRTVATAESPSNRAYPINGFMLTRLGAQQSPLEQEMVGVNATLWTRIEFDLAVEPAELSALSLRLRYEDGFVAYLNGQEVARDNISGTPPWDAQADGDRANELAAEFAVFDISDYRDQLRLGTNVLAVQVVNDHPADPNLLYLPELRAVRDPNEDGISYANALALLARLRITEIMYHPPDEPAGHPDAEFIELQNVGTEPLDLTGLRFTEGIAFTFPPLVLAGGQYAVVVKDAAAFTARYGQVPEVVGEFDGSLSNGGESLVLQLAAPLEAAIMRFEYNDSWYPTTDGGGYALVIREPAGPARNWTRREHWRAGSVLAGSPGTADP